MDFSYVLSYWRLFVSGFKVTLSLSIQAIIASTILGVVVGILFSIKNKPLRGILTVYVEIFRGSPLLMQLFMGYFGVAYLGYEISIQAATLIVFTLYGGAYIAEIIRSGIESIPKGQWEASNCLGLHPIDIMRLIIFPQAYKVFLPSLIGFYLGLIKDTSIASIIGYSELIREGRSIMNVTGKPFETYIIVAIIYFLICFPLSLFVNRMEKRRV